MKSPFYDITPSVKDNELLPSQQLAKFTLRNFKDIMINYMENAKTISENIAKDPQITNTNSTKILQFKTNLNVFEEKYSSCNGYDDLKNLAAAYINATRFCNELEEPDMKIIFSILEKYGFIDLEKAIDNYFKMFTEKFTKKFEDLKDDLENEQTENARKVREWYEEFRNIKTLSDKGTAIGKFILIFIRSENNVHNMNELYFSLVVF